MLLLSDSTTPRLLYVTDFISRYFSVPLTVTTNHQTFREHKGAAINYTNKEIDGHSVWIEPVDLLFAEGTAAVDTRVFDHPAGYKALFQTGGALGFDLFASVFYLLSRYEEYRPHQKDFYGRYAHEESLAHKEGFLNKPLVNIWLKDFEHRLRAAFPGIQLEAPRFRFTPTYDIDIAWSYRNKGFVRNSGGLARSLLQGQWGNVSERVKVLAGRKKDPFDSYDWMDVIHQRSALEPIFFFHVGQQRNSYDRNISISNAEFQQLICNIAQRYAVGLHPSWHSGDEPTYLIKEKRFLDGITGKKVTCSRQHFIRLTLPGTYQQLIQAGITDDYTMGYGTVNGFRASISTSFYWYNLEKEEATPLLIHPFCYMDANSYYEQKHSPAEAGEEMMYYFEQIRKVGGTMITVWHNPFLGKDEVFRGWKEKYSELIGSISNA